MELYPHNQRAYNSLVSMLAERGRACVIQPTGTGKFVIGAHFAIEHPDSRIIWLCPSDYIFAEQKANLRRIAPGASLANVEQMTYATAMSRAKSGTLKTAAEYIILDEFHHIGAPEWSRGVAKIMELNPEARIIGMSATAVRYADGARDMADEFFRGNVASELSLEEALLAGIVPMPTYVAALYEAPEELGDVLARIESVKDGRLRGELMRRYEGLRRSLDAAENLDEVFRRHIERPDAKVIVFCRNAEHLERTAGLSRAWFGKVNPEINAYRTYSAHGGSAADYEAFRQDRSGALKVLYCINRLNEGVHIDGIDGVVMVRPTSSPAIFAQQLGRALEVGGSKTPLVFDLVNNLGSVGAAAGLGRALETAYDQMSGRGEKTPFRPSDFTVHDEVRDLREIMESIRDALAPVSIDEKVEWVAARLAGGCDEAERKRLSAFSADLRKACGRGGLSEGQVTLLAEAGFEFGKRSTGRAVACYETGEVFANASAAAQAVSVRPGAIHVAIRDRAASGGLHWHYADEPAPDPAEFKPPRARLTESDRERIVEEALAGNKTRSQIGAEFGVTRSYVSALASKRGAKAARYVTDEERGEILELLRQGLTNLEITEITGRSTTVVNEVAKANDVRRRRYIDEEKALECRRMLEEGRMSHAEIADALGVPKTAVRGFSERNGLKRGLRDPKPVICVETGERYATITAAAEAAGETRERMKACIARGSSCGGRHWRYAAEDQA